MTAHQWGSGSWLPILSTRSSSERARIQGVGRTCSLFSRAV